MSEEQKLEPVEENVDLNLNSELAAMLDPENSELNALMEGLDQVGPIDAQTDPTADLPADLRADLSADLPGTLNDIDLGLSQVGPAQTKEEIERERMNLLVSHFDEQQMARYAAFRRANIRRAAVKKYASQLLNQPISNNVAVVLAGMSKVLIGDIIELARELQGRDLALQRKQNGVPDPAPSNEPEPLLPTYIREAWRMYKQERGTVPGSKLKAGDAGRLF